MDLPPAPRPRYPQYKNVRPDYLNAVWGVVNWGEVAKRFAAANAPASK